MTLDKIIAERFLSYDHLEYEFEKRPIHVQGRNLTDPNQKSNGSGKSAMQTIVEFCITASNSRGVRDAELVQYGEKDASIELLSSCDHRKEQLSINWIIKKRGSNKLTLKISKNKGDWKDVNFSNINDGKKFILDWFAISKEDLYNYYIINNERFESFFKASNKKNVDLINRFSDSSIIDGIENVDNSKLQSEYDTVGKEISKIEGKIELTEENLQKELGRDFDEELNESSEKINKSISVNELLIEDTLEYISDSRNDLADISKERLKLKLGIKKLISSRGEIEERLDTERQILKDVENSLEEAQSLVNDFNKTDWNNERSKYELEISDKGKIRASNESSIKEYADKRKKILSFLEGIETKLSGSITCPKCSHEFVLGGDIEELNKNKETAKQLKKKVDSEIESLESKVEDIVSNIRNVETSISKINKKESLENQELQKLVEHSSSIGEKVRIIERQINSIETELREIDSSIKKSEDDIKDLDQEEKDSLRDIDNYQKDIDNYKEKIKSLVKEKESLKKDDNSKLIKEYKNEIKKLESDKSKKMDEYEKIGDEIYKRNLWSNNFKQFRMYLANQSLEVMEYHSNRYLKEMGSDLIIKLEGFKTLANGSIKDEITASILRDGEQRPFGSFSGGEKGRLLFVSILANRFMINSTHKYGGLDFLSIDEIFEGIDSLGLKHIVESAKVLKIPVMMITHVVDDEVSDDILLIEKRGGLSKIIK